MSFEQRWARVIGRALLPKGILDGVVDDVDFGERFDDEYRRSRWDGALLVRVCLWLTWLAPLWMFRAFRTFGGLDANAQVETLETMLKSRRYLVRMAATFLKLTATMLLLGSDRALDHIGAYQPPRAGIVDLRVQK
jgi:hypothetical protein